jgi:hypothetical protein
MKHLLALVFLLFVLVPVMAQDVPAEPTNQVVDVIDGTGEGDTVTCEAGATCNVEDGNGLTADTPINDILGIGLVVVLALLLTVVLVFGPQLVKLLSTLVPPETAASIYESGVRFGYQIALNRAHATPNPLDDEFFLAGAKARGYTVTTLPDGSYVVEPPKFTSTMATPTAAPMP